MKREDQDLFYEAVGNYLSKAREDQKMTVSQLATRSGEQFNTIRAIEQGGKFMFHQATWIRSVLGVDLEEMLNEIANTTDARTDNGYYNGDTKKEISLSDLF